MTEPQTRMRRLVMLYTAAWLPFVALYYILLVSQSAVAPGDAILSTLGSTLPAFLLGLLAWKLCAIMPWRGRLTLRFALIHLAAALTYAGLWSAAVLLQLKMAAPESLTVYVRRALGWQWLMGCLIYGFIVAVTYAEQVARRLRAQEALAARAELTALRAQLNPHFLFNALHSVGSLTRSDPAAAENALVRLAELLRYVLRASPGSSEFVTLEEELSFVQSYLELEQIRLGARLRVTMAIEPEALECALPVLALQPLVENAIRHGIASRPAGGDLHLAADLRVDARGEERLLVTVNDSGAGADQTVVLHSPGSGLTSLRQRLALAFTGDAMLAVQTSPGEGFLVTLDVPARSAPTARTAGAQRAEPGRAMPERVTA